MVDMEELQQIRNSQNNFDYLGLICFFTSPIFCMLICNFNVILGIICFIILVVLAITLFIKGSIQKLKYRQLYKYDIVYPLLLENFDNVTYDIKKGFDEDFIYNLGLIKKGNVYKSEDYLEATYNGIKFKQSDVTVKEEGYITKRNDYVYNKNEDKDSITEKKQITYFMGKVIEIDFPYKELQSVVLFTKSFRDRGNSIYDLQEIEVESINFNKLFDIYTANDLDAFYVLTPNFMEKLIELKEKYVHLGLHFKDNKLYIAIWTAEDTFEGTFNQKINYEEEKMQTMSEINIIKDMIDLFNN